MALFLAYASLGISKTVTALQASGAALVPGANDAMRVKIGREGAAALLTVTETANANGSVLTVDRTNGENLLRLDASDLAGIPAGTYTLFIEFFDNADASEWKCVDRQVFQLCP